MNQRSKELMVQELGMKFDEAVELFSDETLESMMMVNVVGGQSQTYCGGAQCVSGCNNYCGPSCSGSSSSSGSSDKKPETTTTTTTTTVPITTQFSMLCGAQFGSCGK